MNTYEKELEVAIKIARESGIIMLKYFDGDQSIEFKEDNSPVTIADKTINSLVIDMLKEFFPEDGVVGEEESTSEYGMGRKWICDPIDGTAGYTQGTPTAMFSLALVIDGKPVLGVAYDPYLDKMYIGRVGVQSECNGQPIHTSKLTLKEGTLAVTGNVTKLVTYPYFKKIIDNKIKMACFSGVVSKACLISKGRLLGLIESGANAHDLAAIHLILEGAGGKITSIDGSELTYLKPFKGAIISNSVVHNELVDFCK
jgi:fructose-1,6-bisphosphatase/inositol monophosphatase family enzyme